ncbi:tyrosine-type recombinase/integrase [Phaeocystidibacter marisrubri]|uniref:Site-specific integrase n=1 Tax=Phaeocystidibacter marisrubri TaxID=1577780 RepID=A0A6L3ZGQ8_9FLAO|nr:site-specific integrase [Phaeocystidibacter marisrubri]
MTRYYTFVRRKEFCSIKVKHLNLDLHTLFIPEEYSKNRKNQVVMVPDDLAKALRKHTKGVVAGHYLFSLRNCKLGPQELSPK